MLVSTPAELFNVAIALIDEKIDFKSIKISDDFVFRIKVDDEEWIDHNSLDFRTANVVINIQKDFLGIYNSIYNEKVTLKNIYNHPHLIVKVEIKDGCIEFWTKIADFLRSLFEGDDMDAKDKKQILALVLALMLTGTVAWLGTDYIASKKETALAQISAENQGKAIEALEKTALTLAENQRTPSYLASHVKNGTIQINEEAPVTAKEIKNLSKKPDIVDEISCNIDETYSVAIYDFKNNIVNIEREGIDGFWASVEFLDDLSRSKLREIADMAIKTKSAQKASLQITATIKDGAVKIAAIIGIGDKRPNSMNLSDVLDSSKKAADKPQMIQGSLVTDE